jgi:hypothetical protein
MGRRITIGACVRALFAAVARREIVSFTMEKKKEKLAKKLVVNPKRLEGDETAACLA